MKRVTAIIFFIFSTQAIATGKITWFSEALHDREINQAFVIAGWLTYEQMKPAWNDAGKVVRKDSTDQPWKKISIDKAEKLVGDIPREFLLIYPVTKAIPVNEQETNYKVERFDMEKRHVSGTFLYQWGCDNSIASVVSLGELREEKHALMALSYTPGLGTPVMAGLDKSLIPGEVLKQSGDDLPGFSLRWIESGYQVSVVLVPTPGRKYRTHNYYLFTKDGKSIELNDAFPLC